MEKSDPYIDSNTGVLKNLLNIKDNNKLKLLICSYALPLIYIWYTVLDLTICSIVTEIIF